MPNEEQPTIWLCGECGHAETDHVEEEDGYPCTVPDCSCTQFMDEEDDAG